MLGRTLSKTFIPFALVLATGAMFLSGCSYATASGRQQMAYARYVKKYSHNRVKQQTKFKKVKLPAAPEIQNTATASAGSGPESVSSNVQN